MSLSPARKVYLVHEVADALGCAVETVYRRHRQWAKANGMPKPCLPPGRLRWSRTAFDAWLARGGHEKAEGVANDNAMAMPAASVADHQARLAMAYGGRP